VHTTITSAGLARALGEVARKIAHEHGDEAARTAVYALFLNRIDRRPEAADPVEALSACAALSQARRILDAADLDAVFETYRSEAKDPAVYFFEEFIRACAPADSRRRGVRYSPPAVVSYMVRGVESILAKRFGCTIADATVVDPCCGTGTFLREIENRVTSALPPCSGPETPSRGRLYGMELMPTACELAKRLLRRSKLLCADALACVSWSAIGGLPPSEQSTDSESCARAPLVVIGNPPYSGHSANTGRMGSLVADYRAGLQERNPKWLQDDYVKFIRMAQHWVDSAGRGIVAFITSHGFLFNPTFRAMRESLMRSFDELYLLDLHGNARLVERASDGEADENVFGIKTGVAISFMVKLASPPNAAGTDREIPTVPQGELGPNSSGQAHFERHCSVFHAEIRGSRAHKLGALSNLDFDSTPWTKLRPTRPSFLFTHHDDSLQAEYAGFPSLLDVFREASVGFVTSRDAFAVAFTRGELLERIADLRDESIPPDEIRARYPVGSLDVLLARRMLQEDPHWREKAVRVLYRPFDWRWAYLSRAVMERPRLPFMSSLVQEDVPAAEDGGLGPNVALAVGRAGRATGSEEWEVVYCADCPTDLNVFRRGGAMLFPRWVLRAGRRVSNVRIADRDADAVFCYIYAILHSGEYRARYREFLMIDFPRIPMVRDEKTFGALARLGGKLIEAHRLQAEDACSETEASDRVHFEQGLRIGGYEVPTRYLEDRRDRELTAEECRRLASIRLAVSRTVRARAEIDEIVREEPPWRNT